MLQPLTACAEGRMAPNVALVHLFLNVADEDEARSALDLANRQAAGHGAASRLDKAKQLWNATPEAFPLVRRMMALAAEGECGTPWRKVFDDAALLSPEAAVALYSLGSPALLERITTELINRMAEWGLLRPWFRVLDLGCGSGRVTERIASRVDAVVAVECSEQMARLARSATARLENVAVLCSDGTNLDFVRNESFDSVLAVDSFPYLVDAGLAAFHLQEIARTLRAGGNLLIMNYSYRGDIEGDRAELAAFAGTHGFDVLRNGTADLSLWDGRGFLLRKKTME
jgi:SAM-dependent methyltransferase